MKVKNLSLTAITLAVMVFACKKNKVEPTPAPVVPTPTVPVISSRAELTKDSLFLYAKEIYYWNSTLPTYEVFNPRQYTTLSTEALNYNKVLFEISKFSNPGEYKVGANSPKFSYIFDKINKNPIASINSTASVDLEGNGNDLGIRFGLYGENSDYTIYATAVYQNSPAEKLGIVRGDKITKINGVAYGTDFPSQRASFSAALDGNTITIEGFKADGTVLPSTVITKAVFKSSPIYKSRVLTAGSKKIGYVAYARFSNAANSLTELNEIFSSFSTAGVTDLVVDFRYNGGGYVSTAQHLINLIAPSTATGVMFSEHYNSTMQAGNAKIMANQPLLDASDKVQFRNGKMITYADIDYSVAGNTENIAKAGTLTNVQNIVFLVAGGTASASELVINSLRPYMNVKLVGRTTYGKPIGFFPITLENKYDVYFSLFETKNSLGQGGYYSGLTPNFDLPEVPSGTIMYDFGNPNDNYLKQALAILAPGVVVQNQKATMSTSRSKNIIGVSSSNEIGTSINDNEFIGMIENRLKTIR